MLEWKPRVLFSVEQRSNTAAVSLWGGSHTWWCRHVLVLYAYGGCSMLVVVTVEVYCTLRYCIALYFRPTVCMVLQDV